MFNLLVCICILAASSILPSTLAAPAPQAGTPAQVSLPPPVTKDIQGYRITITSVDGPTCSFRRWEWFWYGFMHTINAESEAVGHDDVNLWPAPEASSEFKGVAVTLKATPEGVLTIRLVRAVLDALSAWGGDAHSHKPTDRMPGVTIQVKSTHFIPPKPFAMGSVGIAPGSEVEEDSNIAEPNGPVERRDVVDPLGDVNVSTLIAQLGDEIEKARFTSSSDGGGGSSSLSRVPEPWSDTAENFRLTMSEYKYPGISATWFVLFFGQFKTMLQTTLDEERRRHPSILDIDFPGGQLDFSAVGARVVLRPLPDPSGASPTVPFRFKEVLLFARLLLRWASLHAPTEPVPGAKVVLEGLDVQMQVAQGYFEVRPPQQVETI